MSFVDGLLVYLDRYAELSAVGIKMGMLIAKFVGNFDVLKEAAKALGYEFILWNGKVYWACGARTLYTEKDIQ